MTTDGASAEGTESVPPSVTPSVENFDELYREHVDDARRLATILVGPQQAEELVAESFARVLAQLRAGRGPRDNFRAYLHVTIRNGFRDFLRSTRESPVSDQPWIFDDSQPPVEELVEDLEADTAASAFATLPESWQKVLWHVEVEGRKPGEVADLLGMRAGAVSSLAHRAREGLRRAYLDQQVTARAGGAECQWTRSRLSQYVRSDLSPRAEEKVAAHVGACEDCLAAYLQVDRVNRKLAAWIFPVVLLGALPASGKGLAWLVGLTGAAGAGSAGGSSSGSGGGGSAASGGVGTAAVAAAAAAVVVAAAAGGVTWVVSSNDAEPTAADTRSSAPAEKEPVVDVPSSAPHSDPSVPRQSDPAPADSSASPAPYVAPETTPAPADTDAAAPGPAHPAQPATPKPSDPPVTAPVKVVAVAPVAHPITTCDTYGDLDLPTTRGVTYERTAGDGRSGAWTVEATARPGYVLRAGSARTFHGDLGAFEACTRLTAVNLTPPATPILQPWTVEVVPEVVGGPARRITARIEFDAGGIVLNTGAVTGDGWTCTTTTDITCTFDYTTTAPGPVSVQVTTLLPPGGTVTLMSGDATVGTQHFQG